MRKNRTDGFFKKAASFLFYKTLSYLTDTYQTDKIANFGIYRKKVITAYNNMREKNRLFPVFIRWIGFKSTEIEIEHAPRFSGETSYNLKRLLNLAIDTVLAFSDKPLWLTIKFGFLISILSFGYAIYIFIKAMLGLSPVTGWASLIFSIWFLAGIIISVLGMVGVYIGKTFDEVKKRPLYIIQETIND